MTAVLARLALPAALAVAAGAVAHTGVTTVVGGLMGVVAAQEHQWGHVWPPR